MIPEMGNKSYADDGDAAQAQNDPFGDGEEVSHSPPGLTASFPRRKSPRRGQLASVDFDHALST